MRRSQTRAGGADIIADDLKARGITKQKAAVPSGFKKGGKVKKTGMAKVHKGERVIPARKR